MWPNRGRDGRTTSGASPLLQVEPLTFKKDFVETHRFLPLPGEVGILCLGRPILYDIDKVYSGGGCVRILFLEDTCLVMAFSSWIYMNMNCLNEI